VRRLAPLAAILITACGGPAEGPALSPMPPPVTESPEGPSAPTPGPVAGQVRLAQVANLQEPLALAQRPGDETLYVAQKTGEVVAIRGEGTAAETVLDLSGEVSLGGEQGLLGLAFSPDGRFVYVNFTDEPGDTRVVEYSMRADGSVAVGSRRQLLAVDQPYSNHNGGNLVFGPDGYLYVGLGDGGSGGDPEDRAQDLGELLGKMLRIDPRPGAGRPYTVPPDNPFVDRQAARPEIWAYGLRNPWRYSFDRESGDLWIADVGQDTREEIDVQPAASTGGENYGWDGYEGTLPFEEPLPDDTVPPVYDYGRDLGATVIGGYVYRGSAIPGLRGAYLFGDLYNPAIRMLVPAGDGYRHRPVGVAVENLSSFGEDLAGELYLLSLSGPVYRLEPA
jgi:glucose/arabinose dehydrogenase